jgi:hypothetical protein
MDHHTLYEKAIGQVESDALFCAQHGRRLVLGYTSDLDVVLDWDGDVFSAIAEEFLKEEPRYAPGDADRFDGRLCPDRAAFSGGRGGRGDRHYQRAGVRVP